MAKKVEFTPEVLESILVKVTEKFTDMLKMFMDQMVSTIVNRVDVIQSKVDDVNANLTAFGNRIDELERKLQSTSPSPKDPSDKMLKTLMELEAEKTERAKRACNVIITGLHPQQDVHDADVFEEFCENHLTVKPHLIRSSCRRLGQPTDGQPARLKLTLDNSQAVDDLIQSTSLLRQSNDEHVKRVYINRDYTRMEAQMAYEQREKRRLTTATASTNRAAPRLLRSSTSARP